MPRPRALAALSALLLSTALAAGSALAQSASPAPTVDAGESVVVQGNTRSYVEDWLVNPARQFELGGELTFVTADDSPFAPAPGKPGRKLRFTDVGFFSLHSRYSTGGHFEVSGALTLLAKQPSYLDEPVVQSGLLGLRYGLAKKWALWGVVGGGRLMGDLGNWGQGELGLQARTSIDQTIRFQASLGGAATQLYEGADSGRPWFAEVVAHGEALLRSPRGEFGAWLGADYRVPVYHDAGTGPLDPSVRLGFQLGAMIGYVKKWNLYVVMSAVDRGDIEDPATTLPILDGGFDQGQIMFGGSRSFDLASDDKKDQALYIVE